MRFRPFALVLSGLALISSFKPARAATDLLRYNLSIDATACGNTEDVTGADGYYIAGVFVAVLPDGTTRPYSVVTYPFPINDNQWMGYQTVMLDAMLPRGTRIYGQMRFYDEDFGKDWNAVAGKFNAAADAGVKAASASGNPTAAAAAGAAYVAFKVFDGFASADKDDLLGQVDVTIGDNALSPGGVAKIVIKNGQMNYDYNHPARAIIKAQADGAFANKSLVDYYSGDIRFSKSDFTGWSSWAYTQSWLTFIQDPNLSPTTGQPLVKINSAAWLLKVIAAQKAAEREQFEASAKYRKAFRVAPTDKGPQPFTYEGDFPKKTTGPKPGSTVQGGGGIGGGIGGKLGDKIPGGLGNRIPGGLASKIPGGLANKIPGNLRDKIPGGLLGGGVQTGGNGTGNGGVSTGTGIGGAQNLPANDGTTPSILPGEVPGGATIPGMGGAMGTETPGTGEMGAETGADTMGVEMATPGAASAAPMTGTVGKTMAVQLDGKESQDFNLDLPAGQFFITADVQRLGEKGSLTNIDATLSLLKRNGAQMPNYGGSLIYFNSGDSTTRVGKPFSFAKPTGVRFRFKNESNGAHNVWLTVTPAAPVKFLPFAFGAKILPIKIGSNIGTGSTLDARGFQYLRAVIPAGKWSISLGAKSEDNCSVDLNSYSVRGVDYPSSFSIYGVGKEDRKEKIVTFTKPTTLIFRVLNDSQAENVAFDVTIEPATD